MAFPKFKLWSLPLWGGKKEREDISNVCSSDESGFGVMEIERVRFPLKETRIASASRRKIKKKWHSREERKIEKEHDVVIVPKDGVCLSGSESEDSDWSIGWLEPHGPDFLSDDETDDSFAVLVPCYKNYSYNIRVSVESPDTQLLDTIENLTGHPFPEEKNLMDQWLSSLQNF